MEEYISCCGLNCQECEARKATLANDDVMKEDVAKKWAQMYNPDLKATDINCTGCLEPNEQVFGFCKTCKLRICCKDKGFANCAHCPEFSSCETVNQYSQFIPQGKTRLDSIKSSL
jgi:hypothetical protein